MNMHEKNELREWALRLVFYVNAMKAMEIFNNDVNAVITTSIHVYTGIYELAEVLACEVVEDDAFLRINFQGVEFIQVKGKKVDRCQKC